MNLSESEFQHAGRTDQRRIFVLADPDSEPNLGCAMMMDLSTLAAFRVMGREEEGTELGCI